MDPFVVASLGRKTYRTRVIRHNLNPVFDEKFVFQVMRHEQSYSISFSLIDRDKLSGNDFIGTASFPLPTVTSAAPEANPETGLYPLREPPDLSSIAVPSKSRFKLPISRSSSSSNLPKMSRPSIPSRPSQASSTQLDPQTASTGNPSDPSLNSGLSHNGSEGAEEVCQHQDDPDLKLHTIPLILKNKDKWEDKHQPQLIIKAKYMPYPALRQQFWRAMLKQYDADESARVSKVELSTMLDTLGSTLKDSTIDAWFQRFSQENAPADDLTFDQAVICLEEQLQHVQQKTWGDTVKGLMANVQGSIAQHRGRENEGTDTSATPEDSDPSKSVKLNSSAVPTIAQDHLGDKGEQGDFLEKDDLAEDSGEEHVIEIRECPLCRQPRLNKRSDADIVTHIATCASQDWRQVNNIVMAGFVTASEAQRKWYSKVITKISYGGYKLGANSANILVQDRITGQINEERMSVYVRLGIRLMYKGLKSRDMEKKRSEFRSLLTEDSY